MPSSERIDALNRLQAIIPKLRGLLGGPLSVESCDLLRKFIVDPKGAWPFLESMPLDGGKTTLGQKIREHDPSLAPHATPSVEVFLTALSV